MSNFVFSPSRKSFIHTSMRPRFEANGSWPVDAVEVSDTTFNQYCTNAPAGMTRGADDNGQPCWVELRPQ